MEEWIGGLWHRFISGAASREHEAAAVRLDDMQRTLGLVFRAFGGDAGLRVASSAARSHGARRRWLERVAGTGLRSSPATLDGATLRLPERIACYPTRALNRDLYVWLAALAAHQPGDSALEWWQAGQVATRATLQRLPGLEARYRRLVEATLAMRIAPESLPVDEAAQEGALRQALTKPGSITALPPLGTRRARPPQPVPLWLAPAEASGAARRRNEPDGEPSEGEKGANPQRRHMKAERADLPEGKSPLLMMFRAESLLSWAEFVRVNRPLDTDADDNADRAAADMERVHLTDQNVGTVASKVRFDLDLPAASEDDLVLGEGIPLPEWDYRRQILKPSWCRAVEMQARHAPPTGLPPRLQRTARKLKSQFAALVPAGRWYNAQPDGIEPDIDACVRHRADSAAGHPTSAPALYRRFEPGARDLSCLVLADLSLSTDASVNDQARVIDEIRDSLMLFGEALGATGDDFAFHGFSSLKRSMVRMHAIKGFDEAFDDRVRGRIAAIRPGYYTRMGAAIRRATTLLDARPASTRLLLLLSDGKPHDIDVYDGRYGLEDTRHALIEARERGIRPFCVTIDHEGAEYLPRLFGPAGFTVVRKAEELPFKLPQLYAGLTGRG